MANLFLVRGCLCLPKLCALKVMLQKRLEEYQESVWDKFWVTLGSGASMYRSYIKPSWAGESASLNLNPRFPKRKGTQPYVYFHFTSKCIRQNQS